MNGAEQNGLVNWKPLCYQVALKKPVVEPTSAHYLSRLSFEDPDDGSMEV